MAGEGELLLSTLTLPMRQDRTGRDPSPLKKKGPAAGSIQFTRRRRRAGALSSPAPNPAGPALPAPPARGERGEGEGEGKERGETPASPPPPPPRRPLPPPPLTLSLRLLRPPPLLPPALLVPESGCCSAESTSGGVPVVEGEGEPDPVERPPGEVGPGVGGASGPDCCCDRAVRVAAPDLGRPYPSSSASTRRHMA
jgi:hypothetical protein